MLPPPVVGPADTSYRAVISGPKNSGFSLKPPHRAAETPLVQLQTTKLLSQVTDGAFEVGGRAAFLQLGGLHPAPPGLRLTLRRWGALLALAGLALPGVRAADAGAVLGSPAVFGPRFENAKESPADVPAAEPGTGKEAEEAAAAPGEGSLLPTGEPWEAVVSEPSIPAPTAPSTVPPAAPLAAPPPAPAPVAPPVPAPVAAPEVVAGEVARSVPGSSSPVAVTSRPTLVPASRDHLRPILKRSAQEGGLPADLVMALAWKESSWRVGAVSRAGAVGVMQLMPSTVTFVSRDLMGLKSNLDPRNGTANIRMGTRFFAHLVKIYDGSYRRALIAYNQGVTALRTRGSYPGAERFADSVLALRSEFKTA